MKWRPDPSAPRPDPSHMITACGKRGFPSREQAMQSVRRVSWRVRCYQCPDCGWWHVTNAEKR